MKRVEVIVRVRKLRALAGSTTFAGERDNAKRMARTLMVKYKIQEGELLGRPRIVNRPDPPRRPTTYRWRYTWDFNLLSNVAATTWEQDLKYWARLTKVQCTIERTQRFGWRTTLQATLLSKDRASLEVLVKHLSEQWYARNPYWGMAKR